MKFTFFISTFLVLFNCVENNDDALIGKTFTDFKKVKALSNYHKISDTIIYNGNMEAKHALLHLRNSRQNLILFNRISGTDLAKRVYSVLDSLTIQSEDHQHVSIGYCEINENRDENLIAVVKETDNIIIKEVVEVWQANNVSEKIEPLTDVGNVRCLNEWFRGSVFLIPKG